MDNQKGSFGYKIGKKIRLMNVEYEANLLWQICVREIYVLMNHYKSIENLKEAFEKLIEAKNKPKPEAIEKCKPFMDLKALDENISEWSNLTRFCQHSFINIVESGYFLNNGQDLGLVLLLDFNTNSVSFYRKDINKNITEYEKTIINEIMEFEDMPIKTYNEITKETRERFEKYEDKIKKVNKEIENINNIIKKSHDLGSEQNIIDKARKLLDDLNWTKRKIYMEYRFFYNRLNLLNLIDHET
jgi:hypothetical protein